MYVSKWTNKYIDLAGTLPEILVNCEAKKPSDSETKRVVKMIGQFDRIYVELGSGSGGHLIERASQDRSALFIGFELRYKRAFRTAEKAQKIGLTNLLIVRTDAGNLENFFHPTSLDGIFMNFPDPWEREKWKKHRMINDASLQVFCTLLKPEGTFRYKTDHVGYFDDTLNMVKKSGEFSISRLSRDLHLSEHTYDNVTTEFERLFISKGFPTYFVELKKVEAKCTLL